MGNSIVHLQSVQTRDFLRNIAEALQDFLNHSTIDSLILETPDGEQEYYEGLLHNLMRLLVFAKEGLDSFNVILQSEPFRKGAAENTLYKVYHQVIEEFFSPRFGYWSEDSRAAYTGNNAIKFEKVAPPSIKALLSSIEKEFQKLREELQYYETDYQTKMTKTTKE